MTRLVAPDLVSGVGSPSPTESVDRRDHSDAQTPPPDLARDTREADTTHAIGIDVIHQTVVEQIWIQDKIFDRSGRRQRQRSR
jgi:hypothetical protein